MFAAAKVYFGGGIICFSMSHDRKNHTSKKKTIFYRPCHSAVFSYYLLLNTVCVSWMETSEPLWFIDKWGLPYNIRLASAPAWHSITRSQHWVCVLTFLNKIWCLVAHWCDSDVSSSLLPIGNTASPEIIESERFFQERCELVTFPGKIEALISGFC